MNIFTSYFFLYCCTIGSIGIVTTCVLLVKRIRKLRKYKLNNIDQQNSNAHNFVNKKLTKHLLDQKHNSTIYIYFILINLSDMLLLMNWLASRVNLETTDLISIQGVCQLYYYFTCVALCGTLVYTLISIVDRLVKFRVIYVDIINYVDFDYIFYLNNLIVDRSPRASFGDTHIRLDSSTGDIAIEQTVIKAKWVSQHPFSSNLHRVTVRQLCNKFTSFLVGILILAINLHVLWVYGVDGLSDCVILYSVDNYLPLYLFNIDMAVLLGLLIAILCTCLCLLSKYRQHKCFIEYAHVIDTFHDDRNHIPDRLYRSKHEFLFQCVINVGACTFAFMLPSLFARFMLIVIITSQADIKLYENNLRVICDMCDLLLLAISSHKFILFLVNCKLIKLNRFRKKTFV